jgi:dTDP-3-amino-3,4,6-trideoxy-alpha-D-glucose transaminase
MHAPLAPQLEAAFARVLSRGRFVLGDELESFEAAFARTVGTRHAVGVASGLDALELSLRALDVGPGDEVIVPAHTFIATWLAVDAVGATPVPVEPDPRTHQLDPSLLEAARSPRTRAVMPVHLYGHPAPMRDIVAFADRHGVAVLEDAAQAHGASLDGRLCGAMGRLGAFSFYPGKNLGALGDGGAVTTDDDDLAGRLRRLRNYGSRRKYDHEEFGRNARLDELQAALLSVKLPHLKVWNRRRADVAARYLEGLAGLPELVMPEVAPGATPAWHLFVVRHPRREALRVHLEGRGIETLVHYPVPPHLSGAYRARRHSLPAAEALANEVLSLPMGPHLSDEQVEHVVEAVRVFEDLP